MSEKTVIDLKKARRSAKWNDFKAKAKKVKDGTIDYLADHPEVALSLGIAVVSGTVALVKGGIRNAKTLHKLRVEKNLKELYVYDRTYGLGHYWKLRRPLTNSEWSMINSAVENGQKLGDILMRMGVLE